MSNKYWRILLLISVLLVTRPTTAHGSAATLSTTKSYDGLITEWEATQYSNGTDFTAAGTTQSKTTYAFSYDAFGRLTQSARFASEATTSDNAFTERNLSYDKNGNLLSLTRYGNTEIKDNFYYSYSGNRLKRLDGTFNGAAITHAAQTGTTQASGTADYLYDGNGNMTYDALRHLALTYYLNNLVNTVSRNDTLLSTYTYLADGTKYKIIDAAGNGRSYIGPFCLAIEKSGSGSSAETKAYLESIEKDGGRILAIEEETGSGTNSQRSTSYTTLFFIRDHLGSIRAVTDAQGHILERNAYYPFGLQTNQGNAYPTLSERLPQLYAGYISPTPARRDLYNGKEIQTAAGTDYLDYGFRQYDPTAARWFNIDPMAEKYSSLTPYNYCTGNPVQLIDFYGDSIWIYTENVKLLYNNGSLYDISGYKTEIKIKGYVRQVFKALSTLYQTESGKILINSLQDSKNSFIICNGSNNEFRADNPIGAYAEQLRNDSEYTAQYNIHKDTPRLSAGSGGRIVWNPRDGYLNTGGEELTLSPYTNLAHEMGHAYDANKGLLDKRKFNGLERLEWQAVYWENLIRQELNKPLRQTYGIISIINNGKLVKPSWYKNE